jgi:hypothetical protein
MFLFGLFSTHLPYIILSILYLAGFGALSAAKFLTFEKHDDAKIIYHSHTVSRQIVSNKQTYFFVDFNKERIKKIVCKLDIGRIFYETVNQFIIFEKPIKEYTFRLLFSLFSRPPPSV